MAASTSKVIVVLGATGTQGGSVLSAYLDHPEYTIRAITRDPNSPKAQALSTKAPNVEIVAADMSDRESLTKAFEGATSIFAVTDWIVHAFNPAVQSEAVAKGILPNQYACALETQQAKNVFDIAAKVPTLERLVYSTLAHVSVLSHGKYKNAYHFDSKAIAAEYLQSSHPELWKKTSLIQVGTFLENFVQMPIFQPYRDVATGTVILAKAGSEGGKYLWPLIVATEDTGVIVQALIDRVPAQKHVLGVREQLPFPKLAEIFEEVLGEKVIVKYDRPFEGLPDFMVPQLEELFAFVTEFGCWGGDETVIMPEDLGVDLKLGSVKDWVKKQDWTPFLQ